MPASPTTPTPATPAPVTPATPTPVADTSKPPGEAQKTAPAPTKKTPAKAAAPAPAKTPADPGSTAATEVQEKNPVLTPDEKKEAANAKRRTLSDCMASIKEEIGVIDTQLEKINAQEIQLRTARLANEHAKAGLQKILDQFS